MYGKTDYSGPTAQIAHNWFHNTGKTECGNMFYERDTVFSYGTHFPMATKFTAKDGSLVVVINGGSASVSTSRHQNYVKRAIPSYVKTITVAELKYRDRPEDLASRFQPMHDKLVKALHAPRLRQATRDGIRSKIETVEREYAELCELFGLTPKPFPQMTEAMSAELAAKLKADDMERRIREKARLERWAKEEAERQRLRLMKDEERIALWRAGESNSCPHTPTLGALLRLHEGEVQTSAGVTVPIEDAQRLWPMIVASCHTTHPLLPSAHIMIGAYTLRSITQGNVQIGCHLIKLPELVRFAPLIGLNPADVPEMIEDMQFEEVPA